MNQGDTLVLLMVGATGRGFGRSLSRSRELSPDPHNRGYTVVLRHRNHCDNLLISKKNEPISST